MSPPRQNLFQFDTRRQELPEAIQQRCRELMGQMLLIVVTATNTIEEESNEQEDSAAHVSRQAYVYVRQSTMNQVRNHLESQRRQYDLEERARPPNGVGTFANAIPLDQFSRHRREHIDDFDVAKS